MTPISSNAGYVHPFIEKLYAMGDKLLTAHRRAGWWIDDLVQHQKDAFIKRNPGFPETKKLPFRVRFKTNAIKFFGFFWKKIVDYDYRDFHTLFGRFKISEPAIGALLLVLFPFTIGPRLLRAYQRDKNEVGDVLRRDVTAITIFVFALQPLVNALNKIREKWDGLKLLNNGRVFTYKQFEKYYTIKNEKTLQAIVMDGQGQGLKNALKTLYDAGISKQKTPDFSLKLLIDQFKHDASELVRFWENLTTSERMQLGSNAGSKKTATGLKEQFDDLAQKAFDTLKRMDSHDTVLSKKLPKFVEFFGRYAKTRRLPIDVFSFVLCCFGIGLFPVWFNQFWNEKKFKEKMATKLAQQSTSLNPAFTYQALKTSSRLANRFQQNG